MVGANFMAPYVLSFLIAEFVLVMQFLWKYIDDITGKGIGFFEIMELVFYFAGTIVPTAIPISILLSSVFVFGNMSEKFELTSLKSAGISLVRVMRMGFYLAIFTTIFSLFSSNYLVPKANYKFFSRFDVIKRQKPALTLEEKIFNKDFAGYNIYIKKKHENGRNVEGIMIYDEVNPSYKSFSIVTAQKGIMSSSNDGKYFIMNLEDGEQYRQTKENKRGSDQSQPYPFMRTKFKKWEKIFPMSEFNVDNKIFYAQRRKYSLMNTFQLLGSIDSMAQVVSVKTLDNYHDFNGLLKKQLKPKSKKTKDREAAEENMDIDNTMPVESVADNLIDKKDHKVKISIDEVPNKKFDKKETKVKKVVKKPSKNQLRNIIPQIDSLANSSDMLSKYDIQDRITLVTGALTAANQRKDHHANTGMRVKEKQRTKERIRLVLHQMYSKAIICIIFLFIGAPLGSIIRKGGYGYPLLSAIVFFMIFIILSIIGDKLQSAQKVNAVVGAWMPCIVLLPVAIYLTYKALDDQKLVEMNWLTMLATRFSKH